MKTNFDGVHHSFVAQFPGMRSEQEFTVYNEKSEGRRMIQSDTRIGWLYSDGRVELCPPQSGGAFSPHLALARPVTTLQGSELEQVKRLFK